MTRKDRVTAAFSAAAATYEKAAEAQVVAADTIARLVLAERLPAAPRVLEVGCGTGILTRRLLPQVGGQWLVTDIAPAMVEAARATIPADHAVFRVMDAEAPDATGPFDLIVSNLAAQWFTDLPHSLARLAATLAPGGRLVVSTLGAGTFAEWRRIHAALGLESGVPTYPQAHELMAMMPTGGKSAVLNQPFTIRYDDARAFVGALKSIGAGTPRPDYVPLSPATMRRVLAAMGTPAVVTYDLMVAVFVAEGA